MSVPRFQLAGGSAERGFKRLGMVCGTAASLLAVPTFAWGQAAPPREERPAEPAPGLYRIAGTVTDSVTGKALAYTTMRLLRLPARETVQSVTTDDGGHFALEPVPAAKYALIGLRRDYLVTAFDEHDGFSSAIVTGDGQDTEHVPFKLSESSVFWGTVTDESGEPVGGATVVAVRRTRSGGVGEHFVHVITGTTDDEGHFEFWNGPPGTYFLAVQAHPWYAVHAPSSDGVGAGPEPGKDAAALDVAYPVTFYGGTTEEAGAEPIEMRAGTRFQADVTLHQVHALRLRIRQPDDKSGNRYRVPALRQTVFGDQDLLTFHPAPQEEPAALQDSDAQPIAAVHAVHSSTEFAELAPGQYAVTDSESSRTMEVNLNGDTEVDLRAGAPLFGVELKLQMADGSAVPAETSLTLGSVGPGHREFGPKIGDDTSTRFEGVPPGQWIVEAQAQGAVMAVVSVQTGAAGLDDSRIVVKDRSISGSVVLAQGKTSIEGYAKKNGRGQAGVMIVLVPQNPEGGLQRFRRDQSDSDGSFLLPDVVPGEYKVVAIEEGWDLDWARSKVLAPYLAKATAVSVTAKTGASLHLPVAIDIQAR